MNNEYDKQAQDFLDKTGTSFTSQFYKFGKHFDDDKQDRNIFDITLKNDRHTYMLRFGSSLNDSLNNSNDVMIEDPMEFYYGLKYEGLKRQFMSYSDKIPIKRIKEISDKGLNYASLVDKKKALEIRDEFIKSNTTKYSVCVNVMNPKEWVERIQSKMIDKCVAIRQKNFGVGIQADEIKHPRPYDVLACLTKYDPRTFENFCGEYGYDTDSRKAERVYHAVVDEWKNVAMLFNEEELQLLQDIQ